jgi:hypothetical protein
LVKSETFHSMANNLWSIGLIFTAEVNTDDILLCPGVIYRRLARLARGLLAWLTRFFLAGLTSFFLAQLAKW